MKKITLLLVVITLSASCNKTKKEDELAAVEWLVGTWENKTADGDFVEIWNKTNDSLYIGGSYFIKGKDTLHHEQIELLQTGSSIWYITTVRGQNNEQPVRFQLTQQMGPQFVFENPKHDFPKKIIYQRIGSDSLVATISGIQQGKVSSENYPMKRKKL